MELHLPEHINQFVAATMKETPFSLGKGHMFLNLSSSSQLKFSEKDLITLGGQLLSATPFSIIVVAHPKDAKFAAEVGLVLNSDRICVIEPLAPLEFAGLLETAVFLLTVEDEAAHLAAATGTPALVIWPEGPFDHTHSRSAKHVMIRLGPKEKTIPLERAWRGVHTLLTSKKLGIERKWAEVLDLPPLDPSK